jgi:hypothetical protein
MPDPTPIRGRWTLDRMDCPSCGEGLQCVLCCEQAIERAALYLFARSFIPRPREPESVRALWLDMREDSREIVRAEARAVLAAALEQPE